MCVKMSDTEMKAKEPTVTETDKTLKELVEALNDGEVISVSLEGMVLDGQKT